MLKLEPSVYDDVLALVEDPAVVGVLDAVAAVVAAVAVQHHVVLARQDLVAVAVLMRSKN